MEAKALHDFLSDTTSMGSSCFPALAANWAGKGRASQDDAGELLSTAAAEMPLC